VKDSEGCEAVFIKKEVVEDDVVVEAEEEEEDVEIKMEELEEEIKVRVVGASQGGLLMDSSDDEEDDDEEDDDEEEDEDHEEEQEEQEEEQEGVVTLDESRINSASEQIEDAIQQVLVHLMDLERTDVNVSNEADVIQYTELFKKLSGQLEELLEARARVTEYKNLLAQQKVGVYLEIGFTSFMTIVTFFFFPNMF
jgi:hypothetical protein